MEAQGFLEYRCPTMAKQLEWRPSTASLSPSMRQRQEVPTWETCWPVGVEWMFLILSCSLSFFSFEHFFSLCLRYLPQPIAAPSFCKVKIPSQRLDLGLDVPCPPALQGLSQNDPVVASVCTIRYPLKTEECTPAAESLVADLLFGNSTTEEDLPHKVTTLSQLWFRAPCGCDWGTTSLPPPPPWPNPASFPPSRKWVLKTLHRKFPAH